MKKFKDFLNEDEDKKDKRDPFFGEEGFQKFIKDIKFYNLPKNNKEQQYFNKHNFIMPSLIEDKNIINYSHLLEIRLEDVLKGRVPSLALSYAWQLYSKTKIPARVEEVEEILKKDPKIYALYLKHFIKSEKDQRDILGEDMSVIAYLDLHPNVEKDFGDAKNAYISGLFS